MGHYRFVRFGSGCCVRTRPPSGHLALSTWAIASPLLAVGTFTHLRLRSWTGFACLIRYKLREDLTKGALWEVLKLYGDPNWLGMMREIPTMLSRTVI